MYLWEWVQSDSLASYQNWWTKTTQMNRMEWDSEKRWRKWNLNRITFTIHELCVVILNLNCWHAWNMSWLKARFKALFICHKSKATVTYESTRIKIRLEFFARQKRNKCHSTNYEYSVPLNSRKFSISSIWKWRL